MHSPAVEAEVYCRDSDSFSSNPDSPNVILTDVASGQRMLLSNPDSPNVMMKDVVAGHRMLLSAHQHHDDADSVLEYGGQKFYASDFLEHGFKEERFRIDRKKLEDMLQTLPGTNSSLENAEVFFQKVMEDTSTLISWPSKLKIGAKSKKDPHVKIVGKPEDVQLAKEQVLEILDTKKNRVTLKMDVSHAAHSYVIGKGGFKIQQVMEETGCHIHFPDSNRNNSAEKSNQVSIAGQASGVEQARAKIRDLLPLVFMFELPNGKTVNPGEECSPAIQHIQQTYSFNVTFRSIGPSGMGGTLLVVRGCNRLLSRLRQGLSVLMEILIGSKAVPVMGFMKTEIAAQHHQFVMGVCNANVQKIMNKTGTTITFPDSSSFGLDSITSQAGPMNAGHNVLWSKSTVIIQGSFDGVCLAWQDLLKCLPVVLMFDLKEGQELDPVMVNNFMEKYNINIMVRPKVKDNTKSVLIRGAEKDLKILLSVRKEILGVDDTDSCSSPGKSSYKLPKVKSNPDFKEQVLKQGQNLSTAESLTLLTNIIQQNPEIVGLLSNLTTGLPTVNSAPELSNLSNGPRTPGYDMQYATMNHHYSTNVENWINRPDRGYAMPLGASYQNYLQRDFNLKGEDSDSGIFMPSQTRFQTCLETMSDMSSLPESSASSTSSLDTPDYKNAFLRKLTTQSNEQNLGAEIHQLLADYGNKKLSASKAMQQPIGDGVRTPNQAWSGYGFSKSMPDFAARAAAAKRAATQNSGSMSEYLDMDKTSDSAASTSKTWTSDLLENCDSPTEQATSPFTFSNFWETVPQQPAINYGAINSVEQLLNLLDLEKYSELFNYNEIEFSTLLTLTDVDLQQIGITYTARRRLLAAISAIKEQKLGDYSLRNFRAAPGAERKTFMTRFSTGSPHQDENGIM